jgi:hypothetical protein
MERSVNGLSGAESYEEVRREKAADGMTGPSDAPTGPVVLSSHDGVLAFARAACALSGIAGAFLAFAITPDLISRYLSPDNQLNPATAAAVDVLRGLTALLAAGLLLLALRKRWAYVLIRTIVGGNSDVWPWVILAAGASILLIGIGFFVSATTHTRIGLLLSDPNAIAGFPSYYGALEYAGIALMVAAGGISIFSSTLSSGRAAWFLILGGLLTLLFAFDDLYMLHEQISHMNLSDWTLYQVYAALALVFVVTNRSHFLQTPFILLFAAVVFFAVSIVVDSFIGLGRLLPSGLENMLELIGICFWSAYFIKCSRNALRFRDSG